jgi:hypothetical protein
MISKSHSFLLAAAMIAAPMGAAMAQQSTTSGSPAYNTERAAPNSPVMNSSSAATNPNVPGATGETVVRGSGSSMAGSHRVDPNPKRAATDAGAGGGSD